MFLGSLVTWAWVPNTQERTGIGIPLERWEEVAEVDHHDGHNEHANGAHDQHHHDPSDETNGSSAGTITGRSSSAR